MIEEKEFLKEQLAFCKEDLETSIRTKQATSRYLIISLIAMVVSHLFFIAGGFLFFLLIAIQTVAIMASIRNTAYLGLSLYAEYMVSSDIAYYEAALKNLEEDKEEE